MGTQDEAVLEPPGHVPHKSKASALQKLLILRALQLALRLLCHAGKMTSRKGELGVEKSSRRRQKKCVIYEG